MEQLGLIAGSGVYPLLLARAARARGVRQVVAVAFENETSPDIAQAADHVEWIKVGQLGRLISTFTQRGVTETIMAGQIAPKNLFRDIRPDLRLMAMIARLKERNAETIFGAIAAELKKDGVTLLPAGGGRYDFAQTVWKEEHKDFSAEQTWTWCREGLAEACKLAGDFGVILALQNHPPVIDKGYVDVLRMVKQVASPHLKVCFDARLERFRRCGTTVESTTGDPTASF